MNKLIINILSFISILLASTNVFGVSPGSGVVINGHILSSTELVSLQTRLDTRIAPGHYLVDPYSGCWLNIKTVRIGCIGDPGLYPSHDNSAEDSQN